MSQSKNHDSIPAKCKVCGTRVTPDIEFAGRKIECPDCFSPIQIPTLEEYARQVDSQRSHEAVQIADIETYSFTAPIVPATPVATPSRAKKKRPPEERESRNSVGDIDADEDDIFQNRPTASASASASAMKDKATAPAPRKKKARPKPTEEKTGLQDPPYAMSALEALAEIRRAEIPDPPKILFFSNVFEFPWSTPSALLRWSFLTFQMLLTLLLLAFLIYLRRALGSASVIPIGFMALGQFALLAWTLSYAAACGMSIMNDTSAGNNEVVGWPDGGLTDWSMDMLTLALLSTFAGIGAYLLTLPISFATGTLIPYIFFFHALLFPFFILAGLDADSIWLPVSKMVTQSLRTVSLAWIKVTVLLNLVVVAVAGVVFALANVNEFAAAFVAAPIIAAAIFIYFRLLGRMAYTIAQHAPQDVNPATDNAGEAKPGWNDGNEIESDDIDADERPRKPKQ